MTATISRLLLLQVTPSRRGQISSESTASVNVRVHCIGFNWELTISDQENGQDNILCRFPGLSHMFITTLTSSEIYGESVRQHDCLEEHQDTAIRIKMDSG